MEILEIDQYQTMIKVRITNKSHDSITFGEDDYALAKWKWGQWCEVIKTDNIVSLCIAHVVSDGQSTEISFNYGYYYGELQQGKYRITIPVGYNKRHYIVEQFFEVE